MMNDALLKEREQNSRTRVKSGLNGGYMVALIASGSGCSQIRELQSGHLDHSCVAARHEILFNYP